MKTEWVHKKLGDCCESELGKTLDEGRNTGLYRPYLCALNVLWGKIDISIIKQMRIEDSELERYLVKKGDLLVCEGGEIGRCAIWENDDEIYYQNALHRVRFYKEYDAYFFMYLLCHYNDLKLIEQYGKGLTIKHLNQTAFRNIPVCIPDLPAQRRIAAILASADKVIAATQKTIAKYKQIKQGMMEDLLNEQCTMNNVQWKKVRLGEVIELQGGFAFQSRDFSDSGVPLIRIGDITPNGLNISNSAKLPIDYLVEYENFVLNNNDTVIAMSGATTGKCTLVTQKDLPALLNQRVGRFRIKNGSIDKLFLYYIVSNNVYQQKLLIDAVGGAQPNVSPKQIESVFCNVPILSDGTPNLPAQRRIAAILSGIDAKIAAEEKVLQKYEKVKKGLMERLLNEQ